MDDVVLREAVHHHAPWKPRRRPADTGQSRHRRRVTPTVLGSADPRGPAAQRLAADRLHGERPPTRSRLRCVALRPAVPVPATAAAVSAADPRRIRDLRRSAAEHGPGSRSDRALARPIGQACVLARLPARAQLGPHFRERPVTRRSATAAARGSVVDTPRPCPVLHPQHGVVPLTMHEVVSRVRSVADERSGAADDHRQRPGDHRTLGPLREQRPRLPVSSAQQPMSRHAKLPSTRSGASAMGRGKAVASLRISHSLLFIDQVAGRRRAGRARL